MLRPTFCVPYRSIVTGNNTTLILGQSIKMIEFMNPVSHFLKKLDNWNNLEHCEVQSKISLCSSVSIRERHLRTARLRARRFQEVGHFLRQLVRRWRGRDRVESGLIMISSGLQYFRE